MINKQKLLGQYFSGTLIAEALYDLLDKPKECSVIDPMCGQGDLLMPFVSANQVFGIELDKCAYSKSISRLPHNAHIICGNAFALENLNSLAYEGYDIVITNPPYIRRENYKKAESEIDGNLPMTSIYRNISLFLEKMKTLNGSQKASIQKYLHEISRLTDIASVSWLLCMIITKIDGYLAIVVPNTWLGREYSAPIIAFLKDLFEIEYIVNDTNSVWFEGIAQVKTALVIAKRKECVSPENTIKIIELHSAATTDKGLIAGITNEYSLKTFIDNNTISIPEKYERIDVPQTMFATKELRLDITSKFLDYCDNSFHYTTFEELGIACGQGFRSGANTCFIFHKKDNNIVESKLGSITKDEKTESYLVPIIQNQRELTNNLSVTTSDNLTYLLRIKRNIAIQRDIDSVDGKYRNAFIPLPQSIAQYLTMAENCNVNDTKIPDLSAIKTNIRNKKSDIRFWYNLPDFTQRHFGPVFVPRVNGGNVIARFNPCNYIVDANFISFWNTKKSLFTDLGIFALLSSTWVTVLCEETGIVMGGGALKIDAAQLKKMPLPSLENKDIKKLCHYGLELSSCTNDNAKKIIIKIDKLLFSKVGVTDPKIIRQIYQLKNDYLLRRSK